MSIIKDIIVTLKRRFYTPLDWAKYLGVKIGTDNLIGKDHWSSEPWLITIGSHCQLTNCKIFTHGGAQVVRHIDPKFDVFGKVVIGDYVYIGTDALIMPGVTIEDHVLIAAGSVVTKSIPSGSVVAGNPARYICNIEEYYEKNKNYNLNTKGMTTYEKRTYLETIADSSFVKKALLQTK